MEVSLKIARTFYDTFRQAPVFQHYDLPHSNSLVWTFQNSDEVHAELWHDSAGRYGIALSVENNSSPRELIGTILHEMVHLALAQRYGFERCGHNHGLRFRKLCRKVEQQTGFKPLT